MKQSGSLVALVTALMVVDARHVLAVSSEYPTQHLSGLAEAGGGGFVRLDLSVKVIVVDGDVEISRG